MALHHIANISPSSHPQLEKGNVYLAVIRPWVKVKILHFAFYKWRKSMGTFCLGFHIDLKPTAHRCWHWEIVALLSDHNFDPSYADNCISFLLRGSGSQYHCITTNENGSYCCSIL